MRGTPDPNLLATFERVQRLRERERLDESDDPLMWIIVGVTLIAVFLLALSAPWFGR